MRLTAMMTGLALMTATTLPAAEPADPYLWLEEVEGARALDWVRAQNARYQGELEALPGFAPARDRALAILEDRRRIAYPSVVTPTHVLNFWQDETNVRGLWRRATLASYRAGSPVWETLLDLDALGKAEAKNWVWKGAVCRTTDHARCLVNLSDGGKDAVETREFDLAAKAFVPGGFATPNAKQTLAWAGNDALLVATDFGPGTVTASGYARRVKLWRRGTALAEARQLVDIAATDMGAFPAGFDGGRYPVIDQRVTFFAGRVHHVAPDGRLAVAAIPDDADFKTVVDGRAVIQLRTAWRGFPAGALVAYAIDPVLAGTAPAPELVMAPGKGEAIQQVDAAKGALYVAYLADVQGRVRSLRRDGAGRWVATEIAIPPGSAVQLVATADDRDLAFINAEGFTTPDTLLAVEGSAAPVPVATAPTQFDGSKYAVSQGFATSKDGTRVPYFIVRPKGATGPLKTLVSAYGGFEIASTPSYLGPLGQAWIEGGNAFVLANIRGGGEYGPSWHQAALKGNRQRAYDDLHAVAEDLKRTRVAGPLAVAGGSNGGLLVGVAYTQRPDLYQAVSMGVPLADMRRYHKLLAGASWMGEYGDPDKPDEWAFIGRYSPYQNMRKDAKYPRVFLWTSTKDDRVHPGHARKMAARMQELGHPIYYYENIDGGHAGVANLRESAYRTALQLVYLEKELGAAADGATAGK